LVWWPTSGVPATWEADVERLQSMAGHEQKCKTLSRKWLRKKELVTWLKWYSICLTSTKISEFKHHYHQKQKNKK
jgi:hypothetical protein